MSLTNIFNQQWLIVLSNHAYNFSNTIQEKKMEYTVISSRDLKIHIVIFVPRGRRTSECARLTVISLTIDIKYCGNSRTRDEIAEKNAPHIGENYFRRELFNFRVCGLQNRIGVYSFRGIIAHQICTRSGADIRIKHAACETYRAYVTSKQSIAINFRCENVA